MGFIARGFWFALVACAIMAHAQEEDRTVIANGHLGLGFSRQTGGIVRITAVASGHEFIGRPAGRPLLWRVTLRGPSGEEISVDNTRVGPPTITREADALSVHWSDMDVADEKGVINARVRCQLAGDDDTALLRLWVQNTSKSFGLWDVQFPVIAPLSQSGAADVAIGRGTWGMLYHEAQERISGEYPSHNLPMQFVLLHEGENGLYLAAHDPKAMYKRFEAQPGGEFRVTTRATDMGVPGSDWAAPYPFALGVYRGDWLAGCKRYRAWALKEAPWTRKGPLAKRNDVPETIKNVCAWLVASGPAKEVVPTVRWFAEAIGAPVGVHWYDWHQIPFDTDYPNYFPTKPGFAEGVAELTKAGVVVMPYINARLWDTGAENFAEARPFATVDESGDTTIEEYGSGAKLAVMCPTQPFWQDKVSEIVRRLGEECGVNAVYLDQIASAPPRVCFNETHSHPLGSGSWWVDGYRAMLAPIKRWCTTDGRRIGLTTENDAEPYMDDIDGHLIWTVRSDQDIPMNTAVYSGYTLYFASNRAFAYGDESYCLCQARDFVWGTQLGWDDAAILKPEHAAKLEFLARLARLRARALDYLVYGELLEVLRPQNDVPDITGTWNTPKGDGPVKLEAVQAALWRGRDGSVAVLLANADTEAHTFIFLLDADRHGLAKADHWELDRISAADTTRLPAQSGRQFSQTVEVPARDAILVVVRAVQ